MCVWYPIIQIYLSSLHSLKFFHLRHLSKRKRARREKKNMNSKKHTIAYANHILQHKKRDRNSLQSNIIWNKRNWTAFCVSVSLLFKSIYCYYYDYLQTSNRFYSIVFKREEKCMCAERNSQSEQTETDKNRNLFRWVSFFIFAHLWMYFTVLFLLFFFHFTIATCTYRLPC